MTTYPHPELPPIALTGRDSERLRQIASAATGKYPTADFLTREVERARVIAGREILSGLVMMGSRVQFRDEVTGKVRWVTLAYPDEADIAQGKVSILTPIGAALIGLSVSQSIEFLTPGGGRRSLTVLAVRNPG